MSHFISKSGAGKAATLCVMLLLAGCSTYFSKPALYVPPRTRRISRRFA
jgi:hypothetical protein